jgi:PAS domain S-box-containing protein
MTTPAIPKEVADPARLDALSSYDILDTPAEIGFDDVVRLACELCATPVALVSLVAGDRQWFKARVGFDPCQTALSESVCAYTLTSPDILIIPDLTLDPRTSRNALVTGDPYIRFYAGAPLRTADVFILGSLCVIDPVPRPEGLTPGQISALQALARQVMTLLELRKSVADRDMALSRLHVSESRYRAVFESAVDYAIVVMDLDGRVTNWNEGATRVLGWTPDEMVGQPVETFFTPEDRAMHIPAKEMSAALQVGRGVDERWHLKKDGSRFWGNGEMMSLRDAAGEGIGFIKILRDRCVFH